MKSSIDVHSVAYVKRNAKRIKKEKQVSHHEALDLAAKAVGAANWKHFLRAGNEIPRAIAVTTQRAPKPLTVAFNVMFGGRRVRPNVKMPIASHKEIGALLDEVLAHTRLRKSVHKLIDSVRCELDDWVQHEYPTHAEMSDEDFREMYYAHKTKVPLKKTISREEADQLIEKLGAARLTLSFYPECPPLEKMLKKIDLTISGLSKWSGVVTIADKQAKQLKRGTVIRVKPLQIDAVVIKEDITNDTVEFYSDSGPGVCVRDEVKVYRQQPGSTRLPMRLTLPYGKWICEDGSEVLFNRDYKPIWAKLPNGEVKDIEPNTWVKNKDCIYFFDDSNPPWAKKKTREMCFGVLVEWGVADRIPKALAEYYELVRTGIKPKPTEVKFKFPFAV
ncbi:MAG: DUF5623 domain-containing protein [Bdellovibrionales bacterium]|nr:DUF5623 domain-containing protein [Bdellovibrionales bacterium]